MLSNFSPVRPQFVISLVDATSTNLTEQDGLALVCTASNYYPSTSISWFKNTNMLTSSSRIGITEMTTTVESGLYNTQSNLNIPSTLTADTGAYYCKATLQIDGLDQSLAIRVENDISILVQGIILYTFRKQHLRLYSCFILFLFF